jgi:hypothetical protein
VIVRDHQRQLLFEGNRRGAISQWSCRHLAADDRALLSETVGLATLRPEALRARLDEK